MLLWRAGRQSPDGSYFCYLHSVNDFHSILLCCACRDLDSRWSYCWQTENLQKRLTPLSFILVSEVHTPLNLLRKIRLGQGSSSAVALTWHTQALAVYTLENLLGNSVNCLISLRESVLAHHSKDTFTNWFLISIFSIVHQYPVKTPTQKLGFLPLEN